MLVAALTLGLSGCATNSSSQATAQMENLLLAEPAPADPRAQVAIARYSQILSQPSLTEEERAELFYQRGMLYDSVGLAGLAQYDFSQAINLKPDLAPAYNSLGVHLIQKREFDQAYEAFDSTLDIDPEYEFALLNRGIALYYGGRPELGVGDLEGFLEKSPSDPFRAIWAYIINNEVTPETASTKLREYRSQLDSSHWAVSLVDFYLGEITESDVLAELVKGVTSSKQLTERLCEAYFYLGKYHSRQGNRGKALNFFKLSLSTNVYEYVEHRYARLEMARIREAYQPQP